MLDYAIQIRMLPDKNKNYMALTGNYSVAGFELTLRRKVNYCGIVANIDKASFPRSQKLPSFKYSRHGLVSELLKKFSVLMMC